jgi:hypothetical protein
MFSPIPAESRVSVNRRFYTNVELVIWLTLIGLATGWCATALLFG